MKANAEIERIWVWAVGRGALRTTGAGQSGSEKKTDLDSLATTKNQLRAAVRKQASIDSLATQKFVCMKRKLNEAQTTALHAVLTRDRQHAVVAKSIQLLRDFL